LHSLNLKKEEAKAQAIVLALEISLISLYPLRNYPSIGDLSFRSSPQLDLSLILLEFICEITRSKVR